MNEYIYEIIKTQLGAEVIKRTDSNGNESWIPCDESNSDYQAYLASLDEPTALPEINEPVKETAPTEPLDEPSPDTE